jgi:hypothetical protein
VGLGLSCPAVTGLRKDSHRVRKEFTVAIRCLRFFAVVVTGAFSTQCASAYMEYPPTTMAKLCKSPRIRLLKVTKFDKAKGVILFELVENLNSPTDKVKSVLAENIPGPDDKVKSFRHAIPAESDEGKPILEWVAKDKTAVMFTLESGGQAISARACGYVFIDENCYSVVYNKAGDYWAFIRAEPEMSTCFFGKVDQLPKIVRDVLAGKDVKVPTKEPHSKADFKKRSKEVFDALNANK